MCLQTTARVASQVLLQTITALHCGTAAGESGCTNCTPASALSAPSRMQGAQRRRNGVAPTLAVLPLRPHPRRMQGVATAMRYPDESANTGAAAMSAEAAVLAAEEEASVDDQRQELVVLFKNAAKLIPPLAIDAVSGIVQRLRPAAGVGVGDAVLWQDTEVALTLLYELGEALLDEVNQPGCGGFAAAVLVTMTAPVPHQAHRLVASALLECNVRPPSLLCRWRCRRPVHQLAGFVHPRSGDSCVVPPCAATLRQSGLAAPRSHPYSDARLPGADGARAPPPTAGDARLLSLHAHRQGAPPQPQGLPPGAHPRPGAHRASDCGQPCARHRRSQSDCRPRYALHDNEAASSAASLQIILSPAAALHAFPSSAAALAPCHLHAIPAPRTHPAALRTTWLQVHEMRSCPWPFAWALRLDLFFCFLSL